MAIGSKLLSEQPARDRAEHGALRKAARLKSVLVRVNTEQLHVSILLYISGFQIVVRKRVTFRWYASSFQRNIWRRNKRYTRTYILGFNEQYQKSKYGEIYFFKQ